MDEYAQFVTSILIAHGVAPEDVPGVTGEVWAALPTDRAPGVSEVTAAARDQAVRWLRRKGKELPHGPLVDPTDFDNLGIQLAEDDLLETIRDLPPHCQVLLLALLGGLPNPGYATVSGRSGIAIGSIGPARQRCLARLRQDLVDRFG